MACFKRFLLISGISVLLLAGLLLTSFTRGSSTAFAIGCNTVATNNWSNNCQVSQGNISNFVLAIQQSIDDSGIKNVHTGARCSATEDGDFAQNTFNAVECFQGARRLGVDGIVGSQTWGSMYNQLKKSSCDSSFCYYYGPATGSTTNYARNISTGVWWIWSFPHSRWCEMNLNSPC
jgi:peptidoglycan hydrolase-like protein with peptidoglycan-binding domain